MEWQTPQRASATFLRYVQKHTLTQCYIPEDMSHQSIRTAGSPLLQTCVYGETKIHHHHHHHKHQGLDPLIRSVSRAIAALANVF